MPVRKGFSLEDILADANQLFGSGNSLHATQEQVILGVLDLFADLRGSTAFDEEPVAAANKVVDITDFGHHF